MNAKSVLLGLCMAGCASGTTSSEATKAGESVAPSEAGSGGAAGTGDGKLAYPHVHRVTQVDELHGVKVEDPYRWLEDLDSEDTKAWVEAQNKVTFDYLRSASWREPLRERLTQLWNFERYGVPVREGGQFFFTKNDGLQNQDVLYVAPSLEAPARVLLDPNTLAADGTVALHGTSVSPNGKLLAYGLQTAGSDWIEWKVRDVATGHDLADVIKWTKFTGVSWARDSKGFYYSRYDEPKTGDALEQANYFQKLCFHRLGEPQDQDTLIYHRPDQKEWGFGAEVTEDGRFLVVTVWKGTDDQSLVLLQDLKRPKSPLTELVSEWKAGYTFLGNEGSVLHFRTNLDAPRGRIMAYDATKKGAAAWRELVPQTADTIEFAARAGKFIAVGYLRDAHSAVGVFDLAGKKVREVELPGLGSVGGFYAKPKEAETFYSYTSFTNPGAVYRYELATGKSSLWKAPKLAFDPAQYETQQVFYTSKDGTRVPMFISGKKGQPRTGDTPTYLYGYGGFNIPLSPWFSTSAMVWMEAGGVYAVPNLRGGGEYGREWHRAGTLDKKQNVFDDFIAAAEYLIAEKVTRSDRLAIGGASNGGLLVGASITQRPDLFGAALPAVGVLDMLRFHKFTIGWAWMDDYGNPDKPDEFEALYAYSPYHRVKAGMRYPATLVTTADHDDRVVPSHSFKFISALQAAHAGPAPVLIRIETKAGHGAGKPTAKLIEEAADRWAFVIRALGLESALSRPTAP